MKTFNLIGKNGSSRISVQVRADSPEEAISKAENQYPPYDFLTTESGEFRGASLVLLLDLMSLQIKQ
jgi:hypothetical protein